MLVDSLACVVAPLLGTTTSGAFIESATGIREGARTGIAAVVTGLLFVEPDASELHEHLNTVNKPLNTLGDDVLCPGSTALERINASLR